MATDNEGDTVSNVVSIAARRATLRTEKATVIAPVANIINPPKPPKRLHVEIPLTNEQRKELRDLINDWVIAALLSGKKLVHSGAYHKLYTDHLNGAVAHLEEVEAAEFSGCKAWIVQQIRIAEDSNRPKARKNPRYYNTLVTTINARCNTLGISEERRHDFQLARYGVASLKSFSFSQLEDFVQYCRGDNPTFVHKERFNASEQQTREKALTLWLDHLEAEANASGATFDRFHLGMNKAEIFEKLQAREPTLFGAIAFSTFETFWSKRTKGICGEARRGKPPRSESRG